jgi:peptidoglycan/LPS O-acetylase OafA/YrhL
MKYRADIDGLRALAVLAVVQYHLSIPWLATGGFVGVDIFFVISGFLITGIIFEAFANGTYNIADFYDRRIRRIFPALFVVYAFTMVAAFFILYPSETENIGKTILSSVLFVSNVFFSRNSNYFDSATKNNPALHTWSLSVEEQFYVFFPLFLFAVGGLSLKAKKQAILAALVGLFGLGVWWVHRSPTDAFYLVQFRAWELLIGSALAVGLVPKMTNKLATEAIAVSGLAAILVAIFFYDEATLFPGLNAALPCFGSAALIYAGGCHQGYVAKLFSLEPARRIGQISYSMYLWHWPMIVFYAYLFPFRNIEKLGLLLAIFVVAYLSWRYVEQPFRAHGVEHNRKRTFTWAASAMVLTGLVAFNLGSMEKSLRPIPQQAENLIAALNYDHTDSVRVGTCFLDNTKSYDQFKTDPCLTLSPTKRNVLIMGDSHAAHLYPGYSINFPTINVMQATASGCKPVLNSQGAPRCAALMAFMQNEFLPKHHLDTIIISSQWDYGNIKDAEAMAAFLKQNADHVVISGPIVEYKQNLPRIVANAVVSGANPDDYAKTYLYAQQAETDAAFKALALPAGITYVSPYSAICTPKCQTLIDANTPMQFDYGHLTEEGSIFMAKQLGPAALGLR